MGKKKAGKRILITGNAGLDLIEYAESTFQSASPIPENNQDTAIPHDVSTKLVVPSGAGLIHEAIKTLLPQSSIDLRFHPLKEPLKKYTLTLKPHLWDAMGEPVTRIDGNTNIKIEIKDRLGNNPLPIDSTPENMLADVDYLVIHDATDGWRISRKANTKVLSVLERMTDSVAGRPNVLVNIGWQVPALRLVGNEAYVGDKLSPVWTTLFRNKPERVAIVLSASDLRQAGAAISRRISWEMTIEDTMAELENFERFRFLSNFGHIIIRYGYVGTLHITTSKGKRSGKFIYAPNAERGVFRSRSNDGRIFGRGGTMIASILYGLPNTTHSNPGDTNQAIENACKSALLATMRLYDKGFPTPSNPDFVKDLGKVSEDEKGAAFLKSYFEGNKYFPDDGACPIAETPPVIIQGGHSKVTINSSDRVVGAIDIDDPQLLGSDPKSANWRILRNQLASDNNMSRINVGIAICRFGHKHVLNCPLEMESDDAPPSITEDGAKEIRSLLERGECQLTGEAHFVDLHVGAAKLPTPSDQLAASQDWAARSLFVPLHSFGKLVAIERNVIEDLRSIHNLLRSYVQRETKKPHSNPPLSIAVFGPPGTGKSFAVKQIADNLGPIPDAKRQPLKLLEYNVAQFRSVSDLEIAVTRIASVNNDGDIPLVFFDEFDCDLKGNKLGWLKYFLGPMQDGMFYGAKTTITFGRAIFVFAGGIFPSIESFNVELNPQKTKKEKQVFKSQKGPDFISRLRGHINISSVNAPINDQAASTSELRRTPAGEEMIKPVIRRALLLRSLLLSARLAAQRGKYEVAQIDEDILYAMLTINKYNHGARSMEAILQMCNLLRGRIEKASLPSLSQLDMHVDASEFMVRLHRARFRMGKKTTEKEKEASKKKASKKKTSKKKITPKGNAADIRKTVTRTTDRQKKTKKKAAQKKDRTKS